MLKFLAPIFPAVKSLLPSYPIDEMKLRGSHLRKEQFYFGNYSLGDGEASALVIDNVNKPVDFVMEKEAAIKTLFTFNPEYYN